MLVFSSQIGTMRIDRYPECFFSQASQITLKSSGTVYHFFSYHNCKVALVLSLQPFASSTAVVSITPPPPAAI